MTDERISGYLDGELDDAELAEFEASLAADASLRVDVEALRMVRERIRSLPLREGPPDLVDRLLAAGNEVTRERERQGRFSRRGFAAVGAAAAILLAVVLSDAEGQSPITPPIDENADGHAGTAGLADDPIMLLAPAAGSEP